MKRTEQNPSSQTNITQFRKDLRLAAKPGRRKPIPSEARNNKTER